ncbi:MAG: hypothetical protein ACE15D_01920 [Candidatus Eisenbacteria bacterium]
MRTSTGGAVVRGGWPLRRRRMARGFAFGALVVAAGVAISGCLFDLRDAENPTGDSGSWKTPTDTRIALQNLKAATEERVISGFQQSLADGYVFRFDTFDAAGDDTLWTMSRDIQAMTELYRNDMPAQLTWTVRDSGVAGDLVYYQDLGYRLVYRPATADSIVFQGRCTLYFKQDGLSWLIARWADKRDDPNLPTWGYARLNPNLGS